MSLTTLKLETTRAQCGLRCQIGHKNNNLIKINCNLSKLFRYLNLK